MLTSLGQNGTQWVILVISKDRRTQYCPVESQTLTQFFVIYMELGKPKRLLTPTKSGKQTVRKAEWRVGKRLQKSEGAAVMAEIGCVT